MSELTALLEILGEDLTLKMVEAYAGGRCHVPKGKSEAHELRMLLGDSGFAKLQSYFAGDQLLVPMARHWRFKIYTERGLTPRQIARLAGCTEAAYYSWRRETASKEQMGFAFLGETKSLERG